MRAHVASVGLLLLPYVGCARERADSTAEKIERTESPAVFTSSTPGSLEGLLESPRWSLRELHRAASEQTPEGGLSALVDAAADASGHLHVLDRSHSSVLVFDAKGAFVRSIGRRGRGPGELLSPIRISVVGDTIVVSDPSQARVQLFTRDGSPAGTIAVVDHTRPDPFARTPSSNQHSPWIVGLTRAGFRIRSAPAATSGREPTRSMPTPIWLEDSRSGRIDSVGWQESGHKWRVVHSNGMPDERNQPFVAKDEYGFDRNGRGLVFVEQSASALTDSAQFAVRVLGPSGELVFSRRYPVPRRRTPTELIDSLVVAWFGADPGIRRQARDSLRTTQYLPAVRIVLIGRDGSIWLGSGPLSPTHWIVLDGKGDPIGQVGVAANLRLLVVDTLNVWAARYDTDGVPELIYHSVDRP